jgi:hypothetical protein
MSIASVFLSYFLVAGGTFLTTLVAARLGVHNEYLGYIIMAVGGAVGGFLAARASRGSTILEPALGAALVVISMFALGLATSSSDTREIMLLPASMKQIALTSGACAGGGILGAFLSEKLLGDSSESSAPWIVYAALASFGAGVMGSIFAGALRQGAVGLVGMLAVCCLVVGVSSGASARSRPLIATLLGGAIGIGAYFYLAIIIFVALFGSFTAGKGDGGIPSEAYMGLGVVALGAGIVTMIGAAIGWSAAGSKR